MKEKNQELFKSVSNINVMACVVKFDKPMLKAIIQKNAKGKVKEELLDRLLSNAQIVGREQHPIMSMNGSALRKLPGVETDVDYLTSAVTIKLKNLFQC